MIHWLVSQVVTGHCTNKAPHSDEIPDDLSRLEAVAARPVQQQFWLLQQLVPDVGVINIASKLGWQGPLDPRVLQDALYDLVCRHQYLRTTVEYRNEHLVQITHPPGAPAVELIDLQSVPLAERPATRDAVLREAAQRPMPIDLVPAIRCQVVRLDQHQHEVVLIVSHLISDGLSMGVLCADLMHACVARLQGRPATWKTGASVNLSHLPAEPDPEGQLPTIDLPCDFAPPATPTYRGQRLEFSLPAAATRQLVSFSRQHRVSPFVTWMSLVQTVIYAWTREPLIPVDFPMSGRDRSMRRCVGPFLQSATAELAADDTISFASLVQQNSQCVDSATGHARQAHGRRPKLLLDYQTALDKVKLTDAITVMPGELDNGVALAELRVGVRRRRRCFDIHIDFDTDRFAPTTARRFAAQLQQTLQLVTTHPETPLGQIEMLTEQDRQLVEQVNQTARPFDRRQLVDQAIQRRLSHTPGQLAMVDQRHSVSCEQLSRQVESICQDLRSRNIVRGDRVAILMDRSSQAVAAMIATMKCGAAFVPVDPVYPEPRRQQILEAADVRCIVTDAQHRHLVPPETAVVVDQVPLDESPKSSLLSDDLAQPSARNSDDVAYVLFTSGSTGTPKGVQVTHRNLANFLAAMDDLHDTPPEGCWLAVTSMSFDISLFELLWTLSRGLRVVIEQDPLGLTPGGQVRLARRMQEHHITHLQCTPALMQALLREPAVRDAVQRLDKLFVGGDVMPVELASDLSELVGGDVFNMYGPTETTIWSTAWRLPDDVSKVVIGRPLANTTVYVLDQHRRLLPPGIAGELYIGGEGVAAGYFRDTGQTRHRFVDCPGRGRLFRTGDRACMQESGEIEFLGRIDQQVKLDGHRIELGEIEHCLRQHPAVEDAVAVLIDTPQTKTLAAFVIASRNRSTQLDHHELLNHVRNRLPVWMVPAHMETLDKFPLTPSGKLDRRQLASWPRTPSGSSPGALQHDTGQNGRESPHVALAERVRHLVMDTLQLEQLPANARMADLDIAEIHGDFLPATPARRINYRCHGQRGGQRYSISNLAD